MRHNNDVFRAVCESCGPAGGNVDEDRPWKSQPRTSEDHARILRDRHNRRKHPGAPKPAEVRQTRENGEKVSR